MPRKAPKWRSGFENSNYVCNCYAEIQSSGCYSLSCQVSETCWPLPELEWYKYKFQKYKHSRSQIHLARASIASRTLDRRDVAHLSKAALFRAVLSSGFRLLLGDDFKGVPFLQASNFQLHWRNVRHQNATGRLLGLDVQPTDADRSVEVHPPGH